MGVDKEMLAILQDMAKEMRESKERDIKLFRELDGIKNKLEIMAKGQLKKIIGDVEEYSKKMTMAKNAKEAEIYADALSQTLEVHLNSGESFDETLVDAFPQNEEMQKLIKKEFTELKRWVKVEVSDRLYNNMDYNDTNIQNTTVEVGSNVVKVGNDLRNILLNLDRKIDSVDSQVNSVNHIVNAIPRRMS